MIHADPGIIIRPIEEKDNIALAQLIRTVFREFKIDMPGTVYTDPTTDHLFDLFKTPGSRYWVAEMEGKLLGGCGIFPTGGLPNGYAELVKFYLLPASRGNGIGSVLMKNTFISATELGYEHLYLESFPELERAVSMYEKAGFKHLDKPMGLSGHFTCNVWMIKKL